MVGVSGPEGSGVKVFELTTMEGYHAITNEEEGSSINTWSKLGTTDIAIERCR